MEESRTITRKSASNLALAFVLLPKAKRDGMSALYAFCRQVDDVADDESRPVEERRARLAGWRADIARACAGDPPQWRVHQELQPFIRQHKLPFELFDELIRGVEMDLDIHRYETFADLERYCYRVASVVGLICIRVFGYRDAAAEALAERCGVAFQLTNIIRDVGEDAAMGRVYLPQEDLARFGLSAADLAPAALRNGFRPARLRPLLEFEAERARVLYRAADELLPLVEEDSRPALWVLVEIYRRLLAKISARGYDVLGDKVRLSVREKLTVLARGILRRLTA